jgi:ribonuclease P protein component
MAMSVGRLVRSADFEKVLQARVVARSEHFAVHHAPGRPSVPLAPKLSTSGAPKRDTSVDDSPAEVVAGRWLGTVIPKRHARPSVMRSLMNRQIRAAMTLHAAQLPAGLWVVRLRSAFDRRRFISASSAVLREAARSELLAVFRAALQGAAA